MECKFCKAELEEGVSLCPSCGADQNAQEQPAEVLEELASPAEQTVQMSQEEAVEEIAQPAIEGKEQSVVVEVAQAPRKKVKAWQVIVGVVASLIVLAALAIVLLTAFGVDIRPAPNDIFKKDVYTVSDAKAAKNGDKVVAEVNGQKLTNTMLQMFFRMQIVEYLNANADYISYLGIDLEKPLCEQKSYEDDTKTWEQFFLYNALETWRNYQTVYMMAMEEGYKPSEDLLKSLEELPASMDELAAEEGFESADALISDRFGAGCTVKDYQDYCRLYYVSAEYINITPTEQELEDYYEANKDLFEQYGIGKDSGAMVNVRHILVCPEGGTTNEETKEVTYTQAEWDACLAKAQGIYDEWKNGAANEESFAALAAEKSEDGGSSTNGGLYTGITRDTQFVEPFLNWCMDESRNVGDTGIVKTEYGYHIMFFAHTDPQWEHYANTYYLSDYTGKKIEEGRAMWDMEVNYKNIALSQINFS